MGVAQGRARSFPQGPGLTGSERPGLAGQLQTPDQAHSLVSGQPQNQGNEPAEKNRAGPKAWHQHPPRSSRGSRSPSCRKLPISKASLQPPAAPAESQLLCSGAHVTGLGAVGSEPRSEGRPFLLTMWLTRHTSLPHPERPSREVHQGRLSHCKEGCWMWT